MRPFSRFLPLSAAFLTAAIVLAGVFGLDRLERDRLAQRDHAETLDQLSIVRGRIESAINARLFLNRGLVAYASTHPQITVPEFQSFAAALARQQHGIRSIQLAKDSIVSHIYPIAGNEAALGLKLLAQPKQRDAVLRAIESRDTVVAGPVELVQGGTAFVSRTPVFLTPPGGKPDSGAYWGLATVILDKDSLFEEAGLSRESASLNFALRGKDSTGAAGETFWGDPRLFEENSVRLDVTLPNGSWQIAAKPKSGGATLGTPWLRPDGMLLALVAGALAWLLMRDPARLRQMVQQTTRALQEVDKRTAELRVVNERLKAEIHEREYAERTLRAQRDLYQALIKAQSDIGEGVFIIENGQLIFANDALCRQFGYTPEELKALPSFTHLAHPDDRERILENYRRRLAGEQFANRYETGIITRDGLRREAEIAVTTIPTNGALRIVVVMLDITERKRVENALRNQLLFTQALVEAIPSPLFFKDSRGAYLGCNKAFEAALGVSRQEIVGKTVYDLAPRELADKYHEMDNRLFKAPGHQVYESKVKFTDGSVRDILFNKATFADAAGNLGGLVGVMLDITERKQMEEALRCARDELEARVQERTRELGRINDELSTEIVSRKQAEEGLRESEEHFRILVQQAADAFFLADTLGGIVDVNRQACDSLGYSREELLAMSVQDIDVSQTPEQIARLWENIVPGIPVFFEGLHRRKDGSTFPVEVAGGIIEIGGKPYVFGLARNITERKRAQGMLQRQAQMINQIHDSVIATDIDGYITFWNDGAKQMFGYSAEETTGSHISLLYPRSEYRNIRQQVIAHLLDREVYEAEALRRKKSGEVVHIHLILSLLKDRDGEIIGMVGYSMDIDERKRLEQQIIKVSEDEQKRIGQELHDGLGQHLTGIAFLSKVLEQKLAVQSLPEAMDASEIVKLVNQGISKTRTLARGLFPVELEANGLMSALEQLAANVNKLFGIACTFRCDNPVLVHDRIAAINLYRIAQEAVNNAAKHGKASNIQIVLVATGDKISLSVTDDGIGFDPKLCEKNEGMGCHIMRYRAGMLGASLHIQKAVGSGTEVLLAMDR